MKKYNQSDPYGRVWKTNHGRTTGQSDMTIKTDDLGANKALIMKYLSPKERGDALIAAALNKQEMLAKPQFKCVCGNVASVMLEDERVCEACYDEEMERNKEESRRRFQRLVK